MTDREHEQLLATATDRFERRLSEEIGAVRVTIVEQGSAIRQEIATLRVDMIERDAARKYIASLRLDMTGQISSLRKDMTEQFAASRVHTEARHRELLKWALVFWVGQAAAVAGIVSAFS